MRPMGMVLFAAAAVAAEYEIPWQTFDSGGPYTLTGTIGQPDMGVSSDGLYVNSGGFWSGNFGCVVNLTDLRGLAHVWMKVGTNPADLDENGKVDMTDFAILSGWWFNRCLADWPQK